MFLALALCIGQTIHFYFFRANGADCFGQKLQPLRAQDIISSGRWFRGNGYMTVPLHNQGSKLILDAATHNLQSNIIKNLNSCYKIVQYQYTFKHYSGEILIRF